MLQSLVVLIGCLVMESKQACVTLQGNVWHFCFSGPFLDLLITGRSLPPPETKTIKWNKKVMDTYIIQQVAGMQWGGDQKCTYAPDSPHLLSQPSPAPAASHTTQIPCSLRSTKTIFTLVAEPLAAAAAAEPKPGLSVSVWIALWWRRRLSNFLSSTRITATFQNKTPTGTPEGGASDALQGKALLLLVAWAPHSCS